MDTGVWTELGVRHKNIKGKHMKHNLADCSASDTDKGPRGARMETVKSGIEVLTIV